MLLSSANLPTRSHMIDFLVNLPANLAPKSTQIRAKRGSNTKPTCIIFSIPFLIDFGSLLGRILVGFGCQVEGQVDQKIDHMASCWQDGRHSKKAEKPKVFQGFLVPRPSNFERKFPKQRSLRLSGVLTFLL